MASALAALTVIALSFLAGVPANAASAGSPPPDTTYSLQFLSSTKCVDDPGYVTTPGTHVDQWTCDYKSNQRWIFHVVAADALGEYVYEIQDSVDRTKCLNVSGASQTNGAPVILWGCDVAAHNGLWRINSLQVGGIVTLNNYHSGLCLNVAGDSGSNGAWLIQYSCDNALNEQMHWS